MEQLPKAHVDPLGDRYAGKFTDLLKPAQKGPQRNRARCIERQDRARAYQNDGIQGCTLQPGRQVYQIPGHCTGGADPQECTPRRRNEGVVCKENDTGNHAAGREDAADCLHACVDFQNIQIVFSKTQASLRPPPHGEDPKPNRKWQAQRERYPDAIRNKKGK